MRTLDTVAPPSAGCVSLGSGIAVGSRPPLAARLADYRELTKPRIAVLALITVTVGYVLASAGDVRVGLLVDALLGIALVAAGSSALNQWVERETDGRMARTARRPLPGGRLLPAEVLAFGVALGIAGTAWLALRVNGLTAALAAATLVLYAGVYTPLKRVTSLCTAVGAVPGALPPVLGWTAASGQLDRGAFALFAVMFLWQFPHFLAISWLYREQYTRAGLRMLPAFSPRPRVTGWMAVAYALALLPVSLLPNQFGLSGDGYFWAALVLGAGYLLCAARFLWDESAASARRLLWSSLVYLPLLLLSLTWDHFQLLR